MTVPFSHTRRKPYSTLSTASLNFRLTISLKKTEVLYQPPPQEAYSPPHISTDSTNLNTVEHFTCLGSVISNDATISTELDNSWSKASSTFGRLSKRVWQPLCMVQRPGFSIGSKSGYWSGFTNAACAPSLASNGNTTCWTKKSSRDPRISQNDP